MPKKKEKTALLQYPNDKSAITQKIVENDESQRTSAITQEIKDRIKRGYLGLQSAAGKRVFAANFNDATINITNKRKDDVKALLGKDIADNFHNYNHAFTVTVTSKQNAANETKIDVLYSAMAHNRKVNPTAKSRSRLEMMQDKLEKNLEDAEKVKSTEMGIFQNNKYCAYYESKRKENIEITKEDKEKIAKTAGIGMVKKTTEDIGGEMQLGQPISGKTAYINSRQGKNFVETFVPDQNPVSIRNHEDMKDELNSIISSPDGIRISDQWNHVPETLTGEAQGIRGASSDKQYMSWSQESLRSNKSNTGSQKKLVPETSDTQYPWLPHMGPLSRQRARKYVLPSAMPVDQSVDDRRAVAAANSKAKDGDQKNDRNTHSPSDTKRYSSSSNNRRGQDDEINQRSHIGSMLGAGSNSGSQEDLHNNGLKDQSSTKLDKGKGSGLISPRQGALSKYAKTLMGRNHT